MRPPRSWGSLNYKLHYMKLLKTASALLIAALMLACGDSNEDTPQTPNDTPTENVAKAQISLRTLEIGQENIVIEITTSDATETRWLCVMQSTTTLDAATVMSNGTEAEVKPTAVVNIEGLVASMTYEIYAAASNSAGEITMASTLVVQTEAKPAEDATYVLNNNITAYAYTMETNGLRNDYVSFYDNATDRTLFIDFYSPLEGSHLPSGTYPLGDGSVMTTDQRYTYITFFTDDDFKCFTEGSATVTAYTDEATSTTSHHVTAYYTMENGETVSLDYSGTFIVQE